MFCGKYMGFTDSNKKIYNYASKKDALDETSPMCQIAELARHNKLRHEYILQDESGPAHKKLFVVKLVLCQGQEFQGTGKSIKKAQQSAAQIALENTTLPRIPLRSSRKFSKKDDERNPVYLLKNVAEKLGITVQYDEEINCDKNHSYQSVPLSFPQMGTLSSFANLNTNFSLLKQNFLFPHANSPIFQPAIFNRPNAPSNITQNLLATHSKFIHPLTHSPNFFSPTNYPTYQIQLHNNEAFNDKTLKFDVLKQRQTIYKITITLTAGNHRSQHVAVGHISQKTKQKAAALALESLVPEFERLQSRQLLIEKNGTESNNENHQSHCYVAHNGVPTNTDDYSNMNVQSVTLNEPHSSSEHIVNSLREKRNKTKSVISLLHEHALRLKMIVTFELLSESGEPHKRNYILRCHLSSPSLSHSSFTNKDASKHLVSDGEGNSKKSAKQAACQTMIEKIEQLIENDPILLANRIIKSDCKTSNVDSSKTSNVKTKDKRKTIIKDKKLDPTYGDQINPISRLVQICQGGKKSEPVFKIIGEHGQNRHKEFIVEVFCMEKREKGFGPNKRLAKRAAAEAMLSQLGYSKTMPKPGKSLLKKSITNSFDETFDTFYSSQEKIENNSQEDKQLIVTDQDATNSLSFEKSKQDVESNNVEFEDKSTTKFHTFADVEKSFIERNTSVAATTTDHQEPYQYNITNSLWDSEANSPMQFDDTNDGHRKKQKVTFSNSVILLNQCPSDDFHPQSCPSTSVTSLKSELVLVGKMKKRNRAKKTLSREEKLQIATISKTFLCSNADLNDNSNSSKDLTTLYENQNIRYHSTPNLQSQLPPLILNTPVPATISSQQSINCDNSASHTSLQFSSNNYSTTKFNAKVFLEKTSLRYNFTVIYSDFPKSENASNSEPYFSLVQVGLSPPVIVHGSGWTEHSARNDAALNAIRSLANLECSDIANDQNPNPN